MSLFDDLKRAAGLAPLREAADQEAFEGPIERFGEPSARRASGATGMDGHEAEPELPPLGLGGGRDVVLEGVGDNKIRTIKVVRELAGLGLREAKELVERTPCVVLSDVDEAFAEAAVRKFSAAGVGAHISLRNGVVRRGPDVQATHAAAQGPYGAGAGQGFCGGCGKPVVAGGSFCPYCGQRLAAAPGPTGEGRPANAPAPMASGGPGACDVVLERYGERKIQAIKVVRELTGLGLKEAKDVVESAPCVVLAGVDEAFARAAVEAFSRAGISASVRRR